MWTIDGTDSLLRFDPASAAEPVEVPLPSEPTDVTSTLSAVWVALRDGSVVRVNGANKVEATIEVGKDPVALAADQPVVWVADRDGDAILSIDTQTNEAQKTIEVESPIDVAVTDEATWVLSDGGEVQAIDRLSGLTDPSQSFNAPGAMAIETGFGSIWLVDPGDGELDRYDPSGAQDWASSPGSRRNQPGNGCRLHLGWNRRGVARRAGPPQLLTDSERPGVRPIGRTDGRSG